MKIIRCHTLILLFLLGCAFPDPIRAADKLRIGYGAPSVAMAVLWITKEGKVFERNGLDVEVLYLESSLVQRALIAGNIAFGEMTGSLMSAPKLQGADLIMVAGFLNKLLYRLIARSEIASPIDLKGKRVGVSRFGAGADRATRLLLSKLGLNPEKDMTLIQVGGAPTRLAALIANSIDATIVEPPDHKKAQEAGMRLLANMEEMNIPFQHTGLVTTRAQLARSPDVSRRVVKSFVEGIHLAMTNAEVPSKPFAATSACSRTANRKSRFKSCAVSCRANPTRRLKDSKPSSPNSPSKSPRQEPPTPKTSSTRDFWKNLTAAVTSTGCIVRTSEHVKV